MFTQIGKVNRNGKEKWLERVIAGIPKGKSILDAGAGQLQYKKFCKHLRYTSQDFGQYDGVGTGEGLQKGKWDNSKIDIISDIIDIPVKTSSFDAVMCVEVLEHIPYPDKAIREFSRVLRPGGQLITTAPFCSITHYAPYYFTNGFSKFWYQKVLSDNGFEIEEIVINGNYFEYLAQEVRRVPEVISMYSPVPSVLLTIIYFPIAALLLLVLFVFEKISKGSEDLLCYGIFVKARKIK